MLNMNMILRIRRNALSAGSAMQQSPGWRLRSKLEPWVGLKKLKAL
jgi:hypothetical protein